MSVCLVDCSDSWADPHQRQTKRFQQHVALDAFSMPLLLGLADVV